MAALALSGDWTAEFLSGPDSASAPGLVALGEAAEADWTKEFIAEAAGLLPLCFTLWTRFASRALHLFCNHHQSVIRHQSSLTSRKLAMDKSFYFLHGVCFSQCAHPLFSLSLLQILVAGRRNIWSSRRRSCGSEIWETRRANGEKRGWGTWVLNDCKGELAYIISYLRYILIQRAPYTREKENRWTMHFWAWIKFL